MPLSPGTGLCRQLRACRKAAYPTLGIASTDGTRNLRRMGGRSRASTDKNGTDGNGMDGNDLWVSMVSDFAQVKTPFEWPLPGVMPVNMPKL